MAESLRFDISGRDVGAGATLRGIAKDGGLAAESTRRLAEAMDAQKRAAATSAGATIAMAKADKILKDASDDAIASYARQRKSLDDLKAKQDDTSKSSSGLKLAMETLAGSGGAGASGMAAAVGAGVALAGQLTTLGLGFGGLALAAYGVAKPIENAAQKAGGLQQNLGSLDREQRTVAQSILGLGKQYGAFQQALKPEILRGFNAAIRIAGHLMHDVQPIAQQTGKALDQVLLSVDKEFQSGTWQSFFQWMAANAGPDVKLLGQNFNDLLQVLPGLIKDLQPLGTILLHVSDDAIKAAGNVQKFYDSFQQNVPVSNQHISNFLKDLDRDTVSLTNHIPGARAVNNWLSGLQFNLTGTGTAATKAAPKVQKLADTTGSAAQDLASAKRGAQDAGQAFTGLYKPVQQITAQFHSQAQQLNILAGGYEKEIGVLGNYIDAQITERNDLKNLNDALKVSHDRIGLKTQAERNSYSAARTYIQQTLDEGNKALAAHKGIEAQITSLERAIPRLEHVKGKTQEYRDELAKLKGMLDALRREKSIEETVKVFGVGHWQVGQTVHGIGGHTMAAGGLIYGGTPGRDSVPIMAMPGEVVVPTKMVAAGLVDHLRGRLPGFAAGGIVPSYKGGVAGLPPWTMHDRNATIDAITAGIAKGFAATFASMGAPGAARHASMPYLEGLWTAAGGPPSLAHLMAAIAMAESGGNPAAYNPSGATGLWQILGAVNPADQPFLRNPAVNAHEAVLKYRTQGLGAWVTYTNGAYRQFYGNGLRGGIFTRPTPIVVGDKQPERVDVTPVGRPGGQGGAMVNIENYHSHHDADPYILSQQISFRIVAAALS